MYHLLSHEDLLREGSIVEYQGGMAPVIFVSHQWRGREHPDMSFEQTAVLQSALRGIIDGSVRVQSPMGLWVLLGRSIELAAEDASQLADGYLWYDYCSIPQADAVAQRAAIDSIPFYVESSKHFVVLAPPTLHADMPGLRMGLSTWKRRGWCRAERLAWQLSPHCTSVIVVQGARLVSFADSSDCLFDPLALGEFSLDSDRLVVGSMVRRLLDYKLGECLRAGDMHQFRVLKALQRLFLHGLWPARGLPPRGPVPGARQLTQGKALAGGISKPGWGWRRTEALAQGKAPSPALTAEAMAANAFLREYVFASPLDRSGTGWTPLHYAAMAGDEAVIRGLASQSADIAGTTNADDLRLFLHGGSTALSLCARFSGSQAALACLLDLRADVNQGSGKLGHGVLHSWGLSAVLTESLKFLLSRRADLEQPSHLGMTPLGAASSQGRDEAVELLLCARADTGSSDSGTALSFAAVHGTPRTVRLLVEARCDVDLRFRPRVLSPLGVALSMADASYWLGARTKLSSDGHHVWGATPLILAILFGNYEVASGLLDAGADASARNDYGASAADLAELFGPDWVSRYRTSSQPLLTGLRSPAPLSPHAILAIL